MDLTKIENINLALMYDVSTGNQILRDKLEKEIIKRHSTNVRYSLEYFYSVCNIGKRALTVHFFPMSESFNIYGNKITIDTAFNEEELEKVSKNYSSTPPVRSYGFLKGRYLIIDKVSENQKNQLLKVGFNVKDVMAASFE